MSLDNKDPLVIALDAMGGDFAPKIVISGADLAYQQNKNLEFLIYGDSNSINTSLLQYPDLCKISKIIHTDKIVSPNDKPSHALRNGRDSSMGLAITAVKLNKAHACVSAGNTGALMALSKIILRTLPNISRPAITGIVPTITGKSVMLDLGANSVCDAENLVQFAIMGEAFAKVILNKPSPNIGLLNIGSEAEKGNETVKAAGNMISTLSNGFNFYGYVEGSDIAKGIVDVIVTDGFSGNIALKTAEGIARMCKEFMRVAFSDSIFSKIGYFMAKNSLKTAFDQLDPRKYNGAMFLGLNGIVVKSHGSTDEVGFCNSILVANSLASGNINQKIINELNISGHLNQRDN